MKGVRIEYTETELRFLKNNKTKPRKELHKKFNEKFNRDVSLVNIAKACERRGWLTGRSGEFKKGQSRIPGSGAKCANSGSFKKGHYPKNHRPLGSERITKDGFIEVKTKEPRKWELKQRVAWREAGLTIPEGHHVCFKDGNRQNCNINNLELLSFNEQLQINKIKKTEDTGEVKKTVRILGKLIAKTTNKK